MDSPPPDVFGDGVMWAEREISDSSSVGKRLSLDGFDSPNKRPSRGMPMRFYRRLWHTLESRRDSTDDHPIDQPATRRTEFLTSTHTSTTTTHPRGTQHAVLGDITGYSKLDFSVNVRRSTTSVSHPLLDRFLLQSTPVSPTHQTPQPQLKPPQPQQTLQPQLQPPSRQRQPPPSLSQPPAPPTTKPLVSTEQLLSNRQRTSHRALSKFEELSRHFSTSISTGTSPMSLGSYSKHRHSLTLYSESDADDNSMIPADSPFQSSKQRLRDFAIDLVDSSERLSSVDSLNDYQIKEESVEFYPQVKRESTNTFGLFDQPFQQSTTTDPDIPIKQEPELPSKSEELRSYPDLGIHDTDTFTIKGERPVQTPLELLDRDDLPPTHPVNTAGPIDPTSSDSREASRQVTFPDIFEPPTPNDSGDQSLSPTEVASPDRSQVDTTRVSDQRDQSTSFYGGLDPIVEDVTAPEPEDAPDQGHEESVDIDMPDIETRDDDDPPERVIPSGYTSDSSSQHSVEASPIPTAEKTPRSPSPVATTPMPEEVRQTETPDERSNDLTDLFSELTLGRIEKTHVEPDARVAIATAVNKRLVRYSLESRRANSAFYEAVSQKADEMLTIMMRDLEAIAGHRGGSQITVADAKVLCSRYRTSNPDDPPRTQIQSIINYVTAKLPLETVHKFKDAMGVPRSEEE